MARVKARERARERTLTDDELRAVWRAAEAAVTAPDKDGAVYQKPFAALVQFLLLTAARRNEAADMERAELSGADWTLPASRNKTKVNLIRPLSAAAQETVFEDAQARRLRVCFQHRRPQSDQWLCVRASNKNSIRPVVSPDGRCTICGAPRGRS